MDRVSITDVTANTLTVTVRECTTEEGFFRRPDAEETNETATTASSTAETSTSTTAAAAAEPT